ncbi:MAG: penicillin-binding protein activator [Rhodospirillaceae bacterium]|nr:penicillin-binding protein activator [Rhodospirillales bacterium]
MSGTKPPQQIEAARPQVQAPPYVQAPPTAALPPPVQAEIVPVPVPAPLPKAPAARLADKDEVRAALLVPLSGPQAALGQAMSNAAQLALFETGDPRFNLIPLDTKGTAEGAAAAAAQALAQGADILLGPLFSPEVKAAATLARDHGVPMLAFTTDRAVLGNGIYTLGFLPGSQVARVVGYARSQGKERFALLAPSNDYGRAVADAFHAAVPAQGGRVAKVEFYDPQSTDFSKVAKRFTDVDARSRGKAAGQPVAPPNFDAVLMPEGGTRLRSLASLLTYYEIDPGVGRFLGSLQWDDASLANEPSVQGGWFPAPPVAAHQDFEARYGKAFGPLPARSGAIASIAYDATALAAILARQAQGDYSVESLTNPNGFAGVDGVFRLSADGTSERGLAVREITQAGAKEVSPAPGSFTVVGQ